MERAIGETFKVDEIELKVVQGKANICEDENGKKCHFADEKGFKCDKTLDAGECAKNFRKDRKEVVFVKK